MVGGSLIDFSGNKNTRTADINTEKIVMNDIISTPSAKAVYMGVKNIYLGTLMDDPSE